MKNRPRHQLNGLKFILLFLTSVSFGQKFYPGYIIQNKEKTQGFIHYSPSKEETGKILFKTTEAEPPREFTADQVSEFYLEPYQATFLSFEEKAAKKTVFTEVLLRGELSVSQLNSLYVVSREGKMIQIYLPINKMVYESQNTFMSSRLAEIKAIGSLKDIMGECFKAGGETELKHLSSDMLIRAASEYNRCKGSTSFKVKSRVEFGPLVGYQMPSVKFTDPSLNYFDGQPGLKLGITADFVPGSFHARSVLNVQLVYWENKFTDQPNSPLIPLKINLDYQTIRLPVSLKLFLVPGQTGFFINPGLSPYMTFNSKTNTSYIKVSTFTASVFLGAGWEAFVSSKQKLVASIRYEATVVAAFSTRSYLSNLQADLAFKF